MKSNKVSIKDLFKEIGVDIEAKDKNGGTSVHRAALNEYTEALKYLNEAGVDMKAKDNHGMTPVHDAALGGCTKALKYLIEEAGANVNAIDDVGMTPAHYAARDGHLEALKYLIEEAGADVNVQDINGYTPLDTAYQSFREEERMEERWGKERLKEKKELKEIINLLKKAGAKTGEELRGEKKQEDTFERAGRPCDDGNNDITKLN